MSVSESSLKTWLLVANRSPLSKDMKSLITKYVDNRLHLSVIPEDYNAKIAWFSDTYQSKSKGLEVNRTLPFGFISPMRCFVPFPNFVYTCSDNTVTTFALNSNNILNGSLKCKYGTLQWNGYATRLYDGQMEFFCVKNNASIKGVINGDEFVGGASLMSNRVEEQLFQTCFPNRVEQQTCSEQSDV